MTIDKVLGICLTCKKIRVDKERNLWFAREEDTGMYDNLMTAYKGRLTHTYCPEDFEKKMKEIERMKL
jgi:hypothetical protein